MLRIFPRSVLLLVLSLAPLAGCTTHAAARTGAVGQGSAALHAREDAAPAADLPRQLVRRGSMWVESEDLTAARARLERALAALGGRVASVEVRDGERTMYDLRVPPDRLDALMDTVAALGHVELRTTSVVDVTEQVVDVDARLEALRASRDRLRQLLDRASTVQDVVAVERELARVQGELDSLQGRRDALRGQVAHAELTVNLMRRMVLGPLGLLAKGIGVVLGKLFIWRH